MTAVAVDHRVIPPRPQPIAEGLSAWSLIAAIRGNGLNAWSARAYEESVLHRRFLGRTSHLLNAPDAIRHVLVDNHEAYRRTPASIRILRPVLGDGLLLSKGAAWRHQRRTLSPAFTPKAIDLLVPHILSAADEAVAALGRAPAEPVDLLAAVQRLALDIAGRTMFSLEMSEHGAALRDFVVRYGKRLARPHVLDFLLPPAWPSPQDVERRFARRPWVKLLDRLIAERRQGAVAGAPPRDLFDLMMAARDPQTGEAFSPPQLRDQVATMILAGHETTAVTLFWSLYLLALAPDVQERVAAEARGVGEPSLDRLVVTRAVIDEAMRLYPPAYIIIRAAARPDRIGEVAIATGDIVAIAPWVLHRHKRLWREPDAFTPERFLPGAPAIDRFAYLPFGVGPRVCIGAHFALTEAVLALAKIVGAFRIALIDQRPVLPMGVVTTQPDHAPPFRLVRR